MGQRGREEGERRWRKRLGGGGMRWGNRKWEKREGVNEE